MCDITRDNETLYSFLQNKKNPFFQSEHKLVVTGTDPHVAPLLVLQRNESELIELKTSQEEADVIIIHRL